MSSACRSLYLFSSPVKSMFGNTREAVKHYTVRSSLESFVQCMSTIGLQVYVAMGCQQVGRAEKGSANAYLRHKTRRNLIAVMHQRGASRGWISRTRKKRGAWILSGDRSRPPGINLARAHRESLSLRRHPLARCIIIIIMHTCSCMCIYIYIYIYVYVSNIYILCVTV